MQKPYNYGTTISEINDATGFMNGDEFETEQQVREYFTIENIAEMFGLRGETPAVDQGALNQYADYVIEYRAHCAF